MEGKRMFRKKSNGKGIFHQDDEAHLPVLRHNLLWWDVHLSAWLQQNTFHCLRCFHNVELIIPDPYNRAVIFQRNTVLAGIVPPLLLHATKSWTDQALLCSKNSTAVVFSPPHMWNRNSVLLNRNPVLSLFKAFHLPAWMCTRNANHQLFSQALTALFLSTVFFLVFFLPNLFLGRNYLSLSLSFLFFSFSFAQQALHSPNLTSCSSLYFSAGLIFFFFCELSWLVCVRCKGLAKIYLEHRNTSVFEKRKVCTQLSHFWMKLHCNCSCQ